MGERTIVFELSIPTEWPPRAEVPVYTGRLENADLRVTARPDGRLQFLCLQGANSYESTTPELDMPDFANVKVAFSWGGESIARVAINGILFTPKILESGERIKINSRDRVATGLRVILVVQMPQNLTIEEERFIRFLLELQERIARADRVHLLEASAILRRLLLDAHPLTHLVNRDYQCELLFPVVPKEPSENALTGSTYTYINLSPLYAAPNEIAWLTLDSFLSQVAVRGEDAAFSVRDVIGICANIKGGIHFDKPKSEAADQLLKLDHKFHPAHIEASLHALADLSWCVIQGLKPLISEILARHNECPQA